MAEVADGKIYELRYNSQTTVGNGTVGGSDVAMDYPTCAESRGFYGSMYNSSNKSWRVPVNGLYQFNISHVFGNMGTSGGMMTFVLKKTQNIKSSGNGFGETYHCGLARGSGTGTQAGVFTFTAPFQATEQVTVHIGADNGGTANFGVGPYVPATYCSLTLIDYFVHP